MPDHLAQITCRIDREIAEHEDKSLTRVLVTGYPPLLGASTCTRIDYLSVDCEGGDLTVLLSIDFGRVRIRR
jgi:uncharacterized protein YdgA (DUF945 family)